MLGVQSGWQRVKITRVNRASVICQTVKVNLWFLDKKHMLSTWFAVKGHNENILGFDVLNGRTWHLPYGSMWSFGSNVSLNSDRSWEATVHVLHTAPALHDSKITNVMQYLISSS